jgi:hypothetical protein
MMWRGGGVSPVVSPSTFGVAVCDGRSGPTGDIQGCAHFYQVVGLTPACSIWKFKWPGSKWSEHHHCEGVLPFAASADSRSSTTPGHVVVCGAGLRFAQLNPGMRSDRRDRNP